MSSISPAIATSPTTFAHLVHPLEVEAFLREWWGKHFLHIPGYASKFDGLMSWQVLSGLVEQHQMKFPRLRIIKNGKKADSSKYMDLDTTLDSPEVNIRATGLVTELAQGSTMVLNRIEEAHYPVRHLAASLGRILRARVSINSYAGWRTENGFEVHWDDHDVLILQLEGRKHWKIWEPTRLFPFKDDTAKAAEPNGEPIWDKILQQGDVLYIPRGWWHVVFPLDEPTLHLTAGIYNPSGIDLLHWFVERLKEFPVCRMDVPHTLGESDKSRYLHDVFETLAAKWDGSLIEQFLDSRDSAVKMRPILNLPFIPTNAPLALRPGSVVRWELLRSSQLRNAADGGCEWEMNGKRWVFPLSIRSALTVLADGEEHHVGELLDRVSDSNLLQKILADMVKASVLRLVEL